MSVLSQIQERHVSGEVTFQLTWKISRQKRESRNHHMSKIYVLLFMFLQSTQFRDLSHLWGYYHETWVRRNTQEQAFVCWINVSGLPPVFQNSKALRDRQKTNTNIWCEMIDLWQTELYEFCLKTFKFGLTKPCQWAGFHRQDPVRTFEQALVTMWRGAKLGMMGTGDRSQVGYRHPSVKEDRHLMPIRSLWWLLKSQAHSWHWTYIAFWRQRCFHPLFCCVFLWMKHIPHYHLNTWSKKILFFSQKGYGRLFLPLS